MLDRSGRDYAIRVYSGQVRRSCTCPHCGHILSNHDTGWRNGSIGVFCSPGCAAQAYHLWYEEIRHAETERIVRGK